jgi:hypothetical protein
MTSAERQKRWLEIDRELAEIAEGKVTPGTDPVSRVGELLEEQDRLEWEAGVDWFRTNRIGR